MTITTETLLSYPTGTVVPGDTPALLPGWELVTDPPGRLHPIDHNTVAGDDPNTFILGVVGSGSNVPFVLRTEQFTIPLTATGITLAYGFTIAQAANIFLAVQTDAGQVDVVSTLDAGGTTFSWTVAPEHRGLPARIDWHGTKRTGITPSYGPPMTVTATCDDSLAPPPPPVEATVEAPVDPPLEQVVTNTSVVLSISDALAVPGQGDTLLPGWDVAPSQVRIEAGQDIPNIVTLGLVNDLSSVNYTLRSEPFTIPAQATGLAVSFTFNSNRDATVKVVADVDGVPADVGAPSTIPATFAEPTLVEPTFTVDAPSRGRTARIVWTGQLDGLGAPNVVVTPPFTVTATLDDTLPPGSTPPPPVIDSTVRPAYVWSGSEWVPVGDGGGGGGGMGQAEADARYVQMSPTAGLQEIAGNNDFTGYLYNTGAEQINGPDQVATFALADQRYEPKAVRGAINTGPDGTAVIQFPPGMFSSFPHLKLTAIVQPAIWWGDNSDRDATHYRIRAIHADGTPWPDTWCDWEATGY